MKLQTLLTIALLYQWHYGKTLYKKYLWYIWSISLQEYMDVMAHDPTYDVENEPHH